jgi:hypothetical protein
LVKILHKPVDQFNADEPSQIGGEDALDDDIGLDQDSKRDYSQLEENQDGFLKFAKCIESITLNLPNNNEIMDTLGTVTTSGVNTKAKDKL